MKTRDETLFGETEDRVESVSAFTRRVKTLLESGIAPAWVRGEVSNLRAQASGHVYFSLKDAGAQVSAALGSRLASFCTDLLDRCPSQFHSRCPGQF